MRLELFSVSKFRSIENAEKLPLGDFTVLVGPNNEGKSNILQAMAIGMHHLAQGRQLRHPGLRRLLPNYRSITQYNWSRDFPRHLQATRPDGKTTFRFDFSLSDDEVRELYDQMGVRINNKLPISLIFGKSGIQFKVRKPGRSKVLKSELDAIAKFVSERVDIQYVETVRTGENARTIVADMLERELIAAANSNEEYARALDRLSEVEEPILEALSDSITETLRAFLPDVLTVDIEPHATSTNRSFLPRGISLIVDDGNATPLEAKGDGVQSLAALALTHHYATGRARAREFILAIEEPEAHLHPRAIHTLREALRETSEQQQVVISTHSPLLVNRLDLASNIIVRRNRAVVAKSSQELRDALGVRTSDNLASAEVVLLVEGKSDAVALVPLLANRSEQLAQALEDGLLKVQPLFGGAKITYVLLGLRDSLASVHAFLDDDDEGKRAAVNARAEGFLQPADLTFASRTGANRGSELEDLFDPKVYADDFLSQYNVDVLAPTAKRLSKGKWSSRMSLLFSNAGQAWDDSVADGAKRLVSEAVARHPTTSVKPECESVFDSLVRALEGKLDLRVG